MFQIDDSDDDDPCALSENWTFQPESRRWSRVCEVTAEHVERLQAISGWLTKSADLFRILKLSMLCIVVISVLSLRHHILILSRLVILSFNSVDIGVLITSVF